MLTKSTVVFRRILDTGEVTSNVVSSLLVEKLGKTLERNQLKEILAEVSALRRNSRFLLSYGRYQTFDTVSLYFTTIPE